GAAPGSTRTNPIASSPSSCFSLADPLAPVTLLEAAAGWRLRAAHRHHLDFHRRCRHRTRDHRPGAARPDQPAGRGGGTADGFAPPTLFASSAMPASEPNTPVVSIGSISSFWLGEPANSFSASTYFCATK